MFFLNGKCLFVISTIIYSSTAFYVYIIEDIVTPTLVPPKSDLNETEIQEILNLDRGWYTTELFRYDNAQDFGLEEDLTGRDRCYNDYIRCLTSDESNPKPVCAFNLWTYDMERSRTFRSMCDVWNFNCRYQKRVFRILDYGKCAYDTTKHFFKYKKEEKFYVKET